MKVIHLPFSLFKTLGLERWRFNDETKQYEKVPFADELEKQHLTGDIAVFVHKDADDDTLSFLKERMYYMNRSWMFIGFPTADFDRSTYIGKYLCRSHTNILYCDDLKSIYIKRNYIEAITKWDLIQVPKGETKWVFRVAMGE